MAVATACETCCVRICENAEAVMAFPEALRKMSGTGPAGRTSSQASSSACASNAISLSSEILLGMTGRGLRPPGSGWRRFPVASGAVQQALGPDNDRPVDEPVAEPYDAEADAFRLPGRGDDPLGGRHLLAGWREYLIEAFDLSRMGRKTAFGPHLPAPFRRCLERFEVFEIAERFRDDQGHDTGRARRLCDGAAADILMVDQICRIADRPDGDANGPCWISDYFGQGFPEYSVRFETGFPRLFRFPSCGLERVRVEAD